MNQLFVGIDVGSRGNTAYLMRPDGDMSVCIATMRALEKQIKVLDKQIEQIFAIIPNTLTSVPGIGKVYSAGIIAEIGNINRFQSQASVAKYAGLV